MEAEFQEIVDALSQAEFPPDGSGLHLGNLAEEYPILMDDEYAIDEVNEGLYEYGMKLSRYVDQWFLDQI
jgi:hypothetical protein